MRTVILATLTAVPIAVAALSGAQASVTYLPAAEVEAAFRAGRPLLENESYKVHASRRETAGQAEVHARDTDIIHVLAGTATIVTGGRVLEPRTVATDEVRGLRIDGGDTRRLAPGDVLIVPAGTPHWFSTVEGPLTYYVVKVTAAAGGTR